MVFDPNNYVSSNETVLFSGTVKLPGSGSSFFNTREMSCVLTDKKIIVAGDEYLNIVPVGKIAQISVNGTLTKLVTGGEEIVLTGSYMNYEPLIRELSNISG